MLPDTDQSLDPVLVPLLKGGTVNLSQLVGVEGDELRLDLLQQGFNLPLLPLLCTAVRIGIQTIKVRLSRTCDCKWWKRDVKMETVSMHRKRNAWNIFKMKEKI